MSNGHAMVYCMKQKKALPCMRLCLSKVQLVLRSGQGDARLLSCHMPGDFTHLIYVSVVLDSCLKLQPCFIQSFSHASFMLHSWFSCASFVLRTCFFYVLLTFQSGFIHAPDKLHSCFIHAAVKHSVLCRPVQNLPPSHRAYPSLHNTKQNRQ